MRVKYTLGKLCARDGTSGKTLCGKNADSTSKIAFFWVDATCAGCRREMARRAKEKLQ